MLPELTIQEYSAALDAVASAALAASTAADTGPVDALALAAALEIDIAWDDVQPGRARVVRLRQFGPSPTRRSIFLKRDPRPERLHWAAAHEMGELLAVEVFDRLGVDPREAPAAARETIANQLAGRLLLPRRAMLALGRACDWDLFALKAHFSTASHELIARRMLDFSRPITITIFDHGRRTLRRANGRTKSSELSSLELAAWTTAHRDSRPAERADHHLLVRAWPIHEPAWKREILRTDWQDWDDA